jgi:hypothetical protein
VLRHFRDFREAQSRTLRIRKLISRSAGKPKKPYKRESWVHSEYMRRCGIGGIALCLTPARIDVNSPHYAAPDPAASIPISLGIRLCL